MRTWTRILIDETCCGQSVITDSEPMNRMLSLSGDRTCKLIRSRGVQLRDKTQAET